MTTPEPPGPTGPPPLAPPADPPAPVFTQSDLDRIAAREKAEGRRAAEAHLAELLGMSPADAKKVLDDAKAREEADKTELQRAQEAAEAARVDAAAAKADAAAERHAARVERALVAAGVALPADEARRDQVLARAARLVDAEAGADQAAVTAAVATLKVDMPGLFAPPAGGAPPSDPGPGPRGKPGGTDAYTAGQQAGTAAARRTGYDVDIIGGRVTRRTTS